jgi:hypothetical protein
MYLLEVQTPLAHQFTLKGQHRDLVSVAHTRRGVHIHVDEVHGNAAGRGQSGEFGEHLFAQPAPGARIQHESQREGRSPLLYDLTECAMNSTVWAGTSPTAVT